MAVPRKQRAAQQDWVDALAFARANPRPADAHRLIEDTAERVVATLAAGTLGRRAAFAWSGGKDSIALAVVMARAGVEPCFLVAAPHVEYPAFMAWVAAHKPPGLDVHEAHDRGRPLDLAWLADHEDLLLPYTYRQQTRWFQLMQWAGQRDWCEQRGYDLLIMGRRKADGNNVGRDGVNARARRGPVKWSPLCDWTHEDVLNVLAVEGLSLPPVYDYPRGWRIATGPWAKRRCIQNDADIPLAKRETWREVWTADPDVVREAAGVLPAAREFMDQEGLT